MTRLETLWKQHKKLMKDIGSVSSIKFRLEKKLGKINDEIHRIENEQRNEKFRAYLKKHPLQCAHQPTTPNCKCREDWCSGHQIDCKKCDAIDLEVIVDNVWVTKNECVAIWQEALKQK